MTLMTARYRGTCATTGKAIRPGDRITYDSRTKRASLAPEVLDYHVQQEPAAYLGDRRYGSTFTRFASGAEIYRNKRGLCEDAPCCGCCNG